jgi:hypothetical protein
MALPIVSLRPTLAFSILQTDAGNLKAYIRFKLWLSPTRIPGTALPTTTQDQDFSYPVAILRREVSSTWTLRQAAPLATGNSSRTAATTTYEAAPQALLSD